MTASVSKKATNTSPIVPAKESNSLSQYSPAPVQNISPTKKHTTHTAPTKNNDYYNMYVITSITQILNFFTKMGIKNENERHIYNST